MRGGAGELKHRRDHIDDMSGTVPGFATGFDAFRPGNDERGRRAAFVGPGLVASERSVASSGPTGAKTKVGRRGSQGSFRIVSVGANHDFGAGAIVREKHDHGVVPFAHGFDLIEDTSDLDIHAMNHGGMDRHLGGLEFFLFSGQIFPGQRRPHLAWPENLVGIVKVIGRAKLAFRRRGFSNCIGVHDPEFFHAFPSLLSDDFPAIVISVLVDGDIFGQGMKGKVRRGKTDVAKERFVAVLIGMLLEDLDGVVGDSCRTIEAGARFDRRELLVVEVVDLGIEETALILEQVGAIESVFKRLTVDMPFAGVIGSCLLYTSPSPRDKTVSRMPSSA